MRIAGPSADVDDVESLVEEYEEGGKLRERRKRDLDVEGVGGERAWRGQGGEAELNVLRGVQGLLRNTRKGQTEIVASG